MSVSEILKILGPEWEKMRALMRDSLHTDVDLLKDTNEDILNNSGKLLRPMILLLTAKACGEITEDTVRFAAAIELLHNATLMHDDVADESAERRGRPTVVSLLGPSAAVLVGDFWLARAVELVIGSNRHSRVASLLSKTLTDLSEGEMLQLEKASSADTDEQAYYRIIYCKTASLFEAAAAAAADSVGASDELFEAACKFGRYMGIAFQIKDDILDYAGTEELGKPVGIDLKEQKITLPLLGALRNSPREEEIRGMIRDIHSKPENCGKVRDFVWEENGVDYAAARLDEFIGKAVSALDMFPESIAKDYLIEIAQFNAFRKV
ncbi:MAG: polyprenyl synthetase family protein [Bacteroidales bacterium]|nr:polyprenyl synthetase family protein [Bacteroidales bacterium]